MSGFTVRGGHAFRTSWGKPSPSAWRGPGDRPERVGQRLHGLAHRGAHQHRRQPPYSSGVPIESWRPTSPPPPTARNRPGTRAALLDREALGPRGPTGLNAAVVLTGDISPGREEFDVRGTSP